MMNEKRQLDSGTVLQCLFNMGMLNANNCKYPNSYFINLKQNPCDHEKYNPIYKAAQNKRFLGSIRLLVA